MFPLLKLQLIIDSLCLSEMTSGIPFPPDISSGGNSYGGHGHQGTHCADGLKAATKTDASFQAGNAFAEHKCIMFGSSDMMSNTEYNFCEVCKTIINAEDLSDIRKYWA